VIKKIHSVEDLLLDPDFVEWVKNPTVESNLYWDNLVNNHPEQKDIFFKARYLVSKIKFKEAKDDTQLFNKTLNNILNEKYSVTHDKVAIKSKKIRRLQIFNTFKIAASLLLFASLGILVWKSDGNKVSEVTIAEVYWKVKENPKGQKTTFVLPDNTKIILNSESKISYRSDFEQHREVELNGEAFFEVSKINDSPFVVKTGNINTVVLGTTFNVRAFEDEENVSISLNSGQVQIENSNIDEVDKVVLIPGEKAIYNKTNGHTHKIIFDKDQEMAWKDGVLIFNRSTINDFAKSVERWFGVNVTIVGVHDEEWMISGRFTNESLKNILESLKFARKIDYTLNENSVTLNFQKYE
jgi:transmembrane sensor